MPRCPRCGNVVPRFADLCPACELSPSRTSDDPSGDSSPDLSGEQDAVGPLTPIARFPNAAEGGFFAQELTAATGIPASLHMDENFDALSGVWSARFVLYVPKESTEAATEALSALIEQTARADDEWESAFAHPSADHGGSPTAADSASGADSHSDEAETSSAAVATRFNPHDREPTFRIEDDDAFRGSGVHWGPIMLTLAAGSAVFFGVRHVQEQPPAQRPPQPVAGDAADLWDLLGQSREPWIQRSADGAEYRELRIDPRGRVGVLREVIKGQPPIERRFRRPELLTHD